MEKNTNQMYEIHVENLMNKLGEHFPSTILQKSKGTAKKNLTNSY